MNLKQLRDKIWRQLKRPVLGTVLSDKQTFSLGFETGAEQVLAKLKDDSKITDLVYNEYKRYFKL